MNILLHSMTQVRKPGKITLHKHPFWQIDWYKGLKKNVEIFCNGKRYSLDSSKAFIMPPFSEHGMKFSTPYFCNSIKFEAPERDFSQMNFTVFNAQNYSYLLELIFPENITPEMMIVERSIELLIVLLQKEKGFLQEKDSHSGNAGIEAAVEFFKRNLLEDFSLADAAASAKMSLNHFIRVFKKEKGITPMCFFRKMKIEKASELLLYSDLNISQVADAMGYSDVHVFSKAFKKETALSPREYKAKAISS